MKPVFSESTYSRYAPEVVSDLLQIGSHVRVEKFFIDELFTKSFVKSFRVGPLYLCTQEKFSKKKRMPGGFLYTRVIRSH